MECSNWQWRRSVESPWLYGVGFCLFAAVVLLAAQGKYRQRQAGIERRFQARSQTAFGQPGEHGAATESQQPAAAYSTPEDTVIPLWPLGVLLAAVACVSACLAVRAGFPPQGNEHLNPPLTSSPP